MEVDLTMDFVKFLTTREAMQRSRGNIERADRLKAAIEHFQPDGREMETTTPHIPAALES